MFTIDHPITGAKIEVANKDFIHVMNWYDAKEACENLGHGWRLPTFDELVEIYHKFIPYDKGNFDDCDYWSSTKHDGQESYWVCFAGSRNYSTGGSVGGHNTNANMNRVRPVRTL